MAKDDRDILDALKQELDFIEKGGYGRSVRTPFRVSIMAIHIRRIRAANAS